MIYSIMTCYHLQRNRRVIRLPMLKPMSSAGKAYKSRQFKTRERCLMIMFSVAPSPHCNADVILVAAVWMKACSLPCGIHPSPVIFSTASQEQAHHFSLLAFIIALLKLRNNSLKGGCLLCSGVSYLKP